MLSIRASPSGSTARGASDRSRRRPAAMSRPARVASAGVEFGALGSGRVRRERSRRAAAHPGSAGAPPAMRRRRGRPAVGCRCVVGLGGLRLADRDRGVGCLRRGTQRARGRALVGSRAARVSRRVRAPAGAGGLRRFGVERGRRAGFVGGGAAFAAGAFAFGVRGLVLFQHLRERARSRAGRPCRAAGARTAPAPAARRWRAGTAAWQGASACRLTPGQARFGWLRALRRFQATRAASSSVCFCSAALAFAAAARRAAARRACGPPPASIRVRARASSRARACACGQVGGAGLLVDRLGQPLDETLVAAHQLDPALLAELRRASAPRSRGDRRAAGRPGPARPRSRPARLAWSARARSRWRSVCASRAIRGCSGVIGGVSVRSISGSSGSAAGAGWHRGRPARACSAAAARSSAGAGAPRRRARRRGPACRRRSGSGRGPCCGGHAAGGSAARHRRGPATATLVITREIDFSMSIAG